jgi:transcriptional regulator
MSQAPAEYLQGTLDLLILRTLAMAPNHGWAVAKHIQATSKDILQVNQGSLYPALQRLELKGFIRSEWRRTEENRRAKYYELTQLGRDRVERETAQWRAFAGAVEMILQGR